MPTADHPLEHCLDLARRGWRPATGNTVLLAVSGGPDSVALVRLTLDLAAELQLRPILAHMHHGVRGIAADQDREFVSQLAQTHQLPFLETRWAPARPAGFEESARTARYAWLNQIALAHDARFVATGHTRDDQVETILHRILRGTGIRGLGGMPAQRKLSANVNLIRPLLEITRNTLQSYLHHLRQPYCVDATNQDLSRTRARIRHTLLPLLRADFNPRIDHALLRLARTASDHNALENKLLQSLMPRAILELSSSAVSFSYPVFLQIPQPLQIPFLRHVWSRAPFPERRMRHSDWRRLAQAVRAARTGPVFPGAIRLVASADRITFHRSEEWTQPQSFQIFVPLASVTNTPGGRLSTGTDPLPDSDQVEVIDADQITPVFPAPSNPCLTLRTVAPGDRFEALGMEGRERRVHAFLRTRGVPGSRRAETLVLCDAVGIIWVVGHRLAHRVRVTDSTTRRIYLSWQPRDESPAPANLAAPGKDAP
jgi:tRNA(Ile)-lysidine synthase